MILRGRLFAVTPAWTNRVNQPQTEADLAAIRRSTVRGQPFGNEAWQRKVAGQLGLEHTFRPRGRPRKQPPAVEDQEK